MELKKEEFLPVSQDKIYVGLVLNLVSLGKSRASVWFTKMTFRTE
jgi:hypothetical protein